MNMYILHQPQKPLATTEIFFMSMHHNKNKNLFTPFSTHCSLNLFTYIAHAETLTGVHQVWSTFNGSHVKKIPEIESLMSYLWCSYVRVPSLTMIDMNGLLL